MAAVRGFDYQERRHVHEHREEVRVEVRGEHIAFQSEREKTIAIAATIFLSIASFALIFNPANYIIGSAFLVCALFSAALPVQPVVEEVAQRVDERRDVLDLDDEDTASDDGIEHGHARAPARPLNHRSAQLGLDQLADHLLFHAEVDSSSEGEARPPGLLNPRRGPLDGFYRGQR